MNRIAKKLSDSVGYGSSTGGLSSPNLDRSNPFQTKQSNPKTRPSSLTCSHLHFSIWVYRFWVGLGFVSTPTFNSSKS